MWSEREIFDVLNSEGPRTDIILAEVNLLMSNDAHLLRYIMSNEDLQNIPLISKFLFQNQVNLLQK